MRKPIAAASTSLMAIAAALIMSGAAAAGCKPSVNSDFSDNVCIGNGALQSSAGGVSNAAIGYATLQANTTGTSNAAIGAYAAYSNLSGSYNTASGVFSMLANTSGRNNTVSGYAALASNTTGIGNTVVGYQSANRLTTGSANTAIGSSAGTNWTTGSYNVAIANPGVAAEARTIRVGTAGVQTRAFLAGVRGVNITGGQAVVVNLNGQLGVVSSSRRYKQDIQPMGDASSALLKLRPVTFRYREAQADGSRPLQYGLIAEEVAEAMPDLAIRDAEGRPDSVAYQLLPSLLLNEYQKQSRELAATRAELGQSQARLAAVEAEMAQMKLMLERLASAAPAGRQLASAP